MSELQNRFQVISLHFLNKNIQLELSDQELTIKKNFSKQYETTICEMKKEFCGKVSLLEAQIYGYKEKESQWNKDR